MTLIVNHKAKTIPGDKWQMITPCSVTSDEISMTLIVNHKAKTIPGDKWQMITPCSVTSSVQIMQAFSIRDDDGNEQHGSAGDFIVEIGDGGWLVVPSELHNRLFSEIGVSA